MSGKKRPSKSHVFPSLSPKNKGKNKKPKNYFYDKLRRRASATANQAAASSSTASGPPSETSTPSRASTPTTSGDPNSQDILNTERDRPSPLPNDCVAHKRIVSNTTTTSENTTNSGMSIDSTSSMESYATSTGSDGEASEPTVKLSDINAPDVSLTEPSESTALPEVVGTPPPSNTDSFEPPHHPPSEGLVTTPSTTVETIWVAARLPNPLITIEESTPEATPQLPHLSSPSPPPLVSQLSHDSTNMATAADNATNPLGIPPRGGQSPTLTFRPGRVRRKPNSKSKHVFASKGPRRAPGNMMSKNHAVAKRVARLMRGGEEEGMGKVERVVGRVG